MADLIYGKALLWASYDPSSVVTAAARSVIQATIFNEPTKIRLFRPNKPAGVLDTSRDLGIALWNLSEAEEAKPICGAVSDVRAKLRGTVCVCFVAPPLADFTAILLESGAQIVACELPSLLHALRRAVSAAPLSQQGFHPLTTGLIHRLPWPDASHDSESN